MIRSSMVMCILLTTCLFPGSGLAQNGGWRSPPPAMADILQAPPAPVVSLSPARDSLLILERESLPPLEALARPMWQLAGLRFDPVTNGRHGGGRYASISIQALNGPPRRVDGFPDGASFGQFLWSPDGTRLAVVATHDDTLSVWSVDIDAAQALPVIARGVNGAFPILSWASGSDSLLVAIVPTDRGMPPERPRVPAGPVIQETSGGGTPAMTVQDLLADAHEADQFDWLATSQLVIADIHTGDLRLLGEPGVYVEADFSPDGNWLLVSRLQRPYTYHTPWSAFPRLTEVWSRDAGQVITIAASSPENVVSRDGGERRMIGWQDNHAARMIWAEVLPFSTDNDTGVPGDRVMGLTAPFNGEPFELLRTDSRFGGISWLGEAELGLAREYDRRTRIASEWLIDVSRPEQAPRLLGSRNVQDRYADLGLPVTGANAYGRQVILVHDGAIFRAGAGAGPDGSRPFLIRQSLDDGATGIVWRNTGENHERVADVIAPDGSVFVTWYEDPATPPNLRLHKDGEAAMITDFPDPHPQLRGLRRERLTYRRADGVDLTATLYLPPDWQEGQRLPVVISAYPTEYTDAEMAGQSRGSPWRFPRIGGLSLRLLVTEGYAVLEGAAMPVIGDPQTVNDTFTEQILMSAQAAVDAVVAHGVSDGTRVGVIGHSYGAFMTAQLLANSDIFRAGIAMSGSYNRTLTPFGFQFERRTLWEAREMYLTLSPLLDAHQIDQPILFIHGAMDPNTGTFPMQSERMFAAVRGNGGIARLVMLPYEGHSYSARESVMHTMAEIVDWLDCWVKPIDPTGVCIDNP